MSGGSSSALNLAKLFFLTALLIVILKKSREANTTGPDEKVKGYVVYFSFFSSSSYKDKSYSTLTHTSLNRPSLLWLQIRLSLLLLLFLSQLLYLVTFFFSFRVHFDYDLVSFVLCDVLSVNLSFYKRKRKKEKV